MDGHSYVVEMIAAERLADLRAARARWVLIESARGPRRGMSAALGAALIRLGRRLAPGETIAAPNAGVRVAR